MKVILPLPIIKSIRKLHLLFSYQISYLSNQSLSAYDGKKMGLMSRSVCFSLCTPWCMPHTPATHFKPPA